MGATNVPMPDRRTLMLSLRLDPPSLNAIDDDIAWAEFEHDVEKLQSDPLFRKEEIDCYHGPLDVEPSADDRDAFCALNRDEQHPALRIVGR